MFRRLLQAALMTLVASTAAGQQPTTDPLPTPIESVRDVISVSFREFAQIPDANGRAPRMMNMLDEPSTKRFFVNTLDGAIYTVSYDGRVVTPYLDVNEPRWNVRVHAPVIDSGMMSFAFHPQFGEPGTPGHGKFYTYTDTPAGSGTADFLPADPSARDHDTVVLEWTATNPNASFYDGRPPKELFRVAHPFTFHNGGQLGFNPLAAPGSSDYGLLYIGSADGGPRGPVADPLKMPQDLSSIFGKILRIDPLGSNSANGKYGIPPTNPYTNDGRANTLGEIYAYGLRNPQRFTWDPKDGRMYVADIGEAFIEEISPVTSGANLGWSRWEGSYRYLGAQGLDAANPRSEEGLTWPVVEYDHRDPLLPPRDAITGLIVYRDGPLTALRNKMIFGDIPSGQLFYVDADNLPRGGNSTIRRLLLNDGGTSKTLVQLIQEKRPQTGGRGRGAGGGRADLRFGFSSQQQIFILNKADGIIRQLVP
jgi:hypothetical protein